MRGYEFDLDVVWANLPALLEGLQLTLLISAIGIAGSLLVGICGAAARSQRVPIVSQLFVGWVELIRNTPHLVQIFFLYFALPGLGLLLSGFTVSVISLILWGAAYNVENLRAGFDAVSARYVDAARSLGLGRVQTLYYIIIPNGVRIALPSVTNTCISTVKGSSLMVVIGLPELTQRSTSLVALTFRVYEIFAVTGAMYLVLVWALSAVMHSIERRLTLPS